VLSFSQTLFALLGLVGRRIIVTATPESSASGVVAYGTLREGAGLVRADDATAGEALYFALEEGGGFYLRRADFRGACVEGEDRLRIDLDGLTLTVGGLV
jgi:hypothetical protein